MEVSVIVPMYNVQRYVAACVQSLRTQTWHDFEVVCVDDCSQDASLATAREAARGDGRFRFLQLPAHGGLSAARNYGMAAARGDYLLFLDSDDLLRGDAVQVLCQRAEADRLDDLFFSAASVYEDAAVAAVHTEDMLHRPSFDAVMSGPELFTWFMRNDAFWPSAPLHMVRRAFIEEQDIGFYEGILHEDELYTVQTLSRARRAAFLNEPLYLRRMRAASIMTSKRSIRNVAGVFRVTQELQRFIEQHAADYDDAFIDAYTFHLMALRNYGAHDARQVPAADLEAYADTLCVSDRIDFDLYFRENAQNIDKIYQDVRDTTPFQVGEALLTVPALLRRLLLR